jgi:hypothetical protein
MSGRGNLSNAAGGKTHDETADPVTHAPARTHTYPVCRPPQNKACQHQKVWAYRHSRLCDNDISIVAAVFGITKSALLETAFRTSGLRQLN